MMPGALRSAVLLALVASLALPARVPAAPVPSSATGEASDSGWLVGGTRPQDYQVELEPEGGRNGTLAASLRSRGPGSPPEGFVSLMRRVVPTEYLGSRLRLSAWVKAESVAGWSGLWLRVDGPERGKPLGFDNMDDRPIRDTRDWRRYEVVVDVPESARVLYYGILLSGAGRVWVDDFDLEMVGPEVPVTRAPQPIYDTPQNLDIDHPPEAPP